MTDSNSFAIVVVGVGAVGKSSLTLRFTHDKFPTKYDPTIEDSYMRQYEVDGKPCILNILDTAGQEEFATLRDEYLKDGEAFILVYSVTSLSSLDGLKEISEAICRAKKTDSIPRIMVGNKIDLEDERVITKEDAMKLAKELGDIPLIETSAKTGENVADVFYETVFLNFISLGPFD